MHEPEQVGVAFAVAGPDGLLEGHPARSPVGGLEVFDRRVATLELG